MFTERGKSDRDIARDRLLTRMMDAKDGGDSTEIVDALAEAKRYLRDNHVGDNAIRDAQFQLHKAFPPAH